MKDARLAGVLVAALWLVACGDNGRAGSPVDAGFPRADGGAIIDGGFSIDGGVAIDGGAAVDGGVAIDGGVPPDAGAPDGGDPVTASALCATPAMDSLYSGFLPTNPNAAAPAATTCVKADHDVIILLGCPSNSDGSPSTCQVSRVEIGRALERAGLGSNYIVSGAAVHNAHVEAEALRSILLQRGVPSERIVLEPRAEHTDENIYYATLLMEARGWESAFIVSEDPGHLVMAAVCDANCCVKKGRLTVFDFSLEIGGTVQTKKVGHYARFPHAAAVTQGECDQIQGPLKFMCTNLSARRACEGRLTLP